MVLPLILSGLKRVEFKKYNGEQKLKEQKNKRHKWVQIINGYNPAKNAWFIAKLKCIKPYMKGIHEIYSNGLEVYVPEPVIGYTFGTKVHEENIHNIPIWTSPLGKFCWKHGCLVGKKKCTCLH